MKNIFIFIFLSLLGIIFAFFPKKLLTYNPITKKYSRGNWTEEDVVIRVWILKVAGYILFALILIGIVTRNFF